jgi:hypothetical protein
MKIASTMIIRYSELSLAILLAFPGLRVSAQTKPDSASATQAAAVLARITQVIDETNLATLHRSVHPLARAEFDQGAAPDSLPVNRMLLVLQRSTQQETALRNLMDEQQTRSSPNYHAWLTPTQFGQQFGPASVDIQKVTDWLSQKGFTGIRAASSGMFIEFSGTAGTVRNAFHTEIHNFLVNGEKHMANVSDPQIPAALAPVVARIHSLHDFRQKSFMHFSKALEQAKSEGRLKPGFGTGMGLYAVGAGDLAKIYNIPATVGTTPAGMGQTVAIVARSNINTQDINDYGNGFNLANLKAFTAANNIIVNGPDPGIVLGDDGEATLDVEMVGAVAPNATILLVISGGTQTGVLAGTQPTDGVDQSALYIVDNNLAPVMSQSFGSCEADTDTAFSSTLWEQAAAQGITVMVSTGDSGSDVCDADNGNLNAAQFGLSVSGSASTPFNVAVGGTDFDDATNPTTFWNNTAALETAISYIPEITWNDSCAAAGSLTGCTSVDPLGLDLEGGSGGQSNCGVQSLTTNACTGYPKPPWQSAPGVPADGVRDIPDVSLFAAVNSASTHFYIMCLADSSAQQGAACNLTGPNFNFSGVGGTSASTPAFAGMMALVNQSESAAGRGGRQGNANYVLYKLAAAQGTSPGTSACNSSLGPGGISALCTFNDITKGNNSMECVGGSSSSCSNQTAGGLGILLEPAKPNPPFSATTPGWQTTAGYDLATGLGSVNASNLIANWSTVTTNFKSATPAITSPATGTVNITHGATQSFTISVTSGSGTPTGDVSLIAEPPGFAQVGVGNATLSGGTATISTNMLPGDNTTGTGTPYPVIAHYAGDGTFGPSDSAAINVTVNRENSTTSANIWASDPNGVLLSQNATSVQYGSNYFMVVSVVGATAGTICNNSSTTSATNIPVVPCPTGNITLTDGGKSLNDFLKTGSANTNTSTVGNLGFVEDLLIQLPGGSNPIVATYSGDNSYNASASPTNTITVNPGPTQTALTANGATSAAVTTAQTVTLVATISTNYTQDNLPSASNGAGPTGTVTFSACGAGPSCTGTVVPTAATATTGAFATATLTTTFTTPGTKTITATYAGDTNYTGSGPSTAVTVTVTQAQVGNFAVSYSPQPLVLSSATGAAVPLTVTVTPAGGFTGMVAVTSTAATLPPGVSCTPSPLNINVTGAAAVPGQLMCMVTATSSTLTASDAREDRMFEAKAIPPANAIPQTTPGKGWWALSAGTGFAALFLMFLPGGRKKYRAALGLGLVCILSLTIGCGGGGTTTPPPPLTATVTKLTVTSGKVASGTAFSFSVAVTGGTPTGMVELFDNGTMIGTAATVSGGAATLTGPAALPVGTHSISAHYLGDTTTLASASGTLNLTVTGSTTATITTTPVGTPAAPAINITIQ